MSKYLFVTDNKEIVGKHASDYPIHLNYTVSFPVLYATLDNVDIRLSSDLSPRSQSFLFWLLGLVVHTSNQLLTIGSIEKGNTDYPDSDPDSYTREEMLYVEVGTMGVAKVELYGWKDK